MNPLKYSIICEDDAQRYFAETLLSVHFKNEAAFVFDEIFYKKYKCSNNADVLKSYQIHIERSSFLYPFELHFVFVGLDYDDRPKHHYDTHLKNLFEPLAPHAKHKAVIFFPVEAIEHWLLFLQWRIDNPTATKNITNDIEGIKRKQAKLILYKGSTQKVQVQELVTNLVTQMDAEWLCRQSISFKAFYTRVQQVIQQAQAVKN